MAEVVSYDQSCFKRGSGGPLVVVVALFSSPRRSLLVVNAQFSVVELRVSFYLCHPSQRTLVSLALETSGLCRRTTLKLRVREGVLRSLGCGLLS